MTTIRTASMAVRMIGNDIVFAHTERSPTDAEWNQGLDAFRNAPDPRTMRVFVYTAGGAPNAAQRARLNALLGGVQPPMAVMSTSPMARAAITAISWFNPKMKGFSPDEPDRALDHLGVTGEARTTLKRAMTELRAMIERASA